MNCERAVELVTGPVDAYTAEERRDAQAHMAECADCRSAAMSVHALRLLGLEPVPSPRPGFLDRALSQVTESNRATVSNRRPFWTGLGVGAGLAASVAIALLLLVSPGGVERNGATPGLELALNAAHDVSISLSTESALTDAEIRVTLNGEIGIEGYDGQRSLQWRTDLEAGTNRLTLPVVATGIRGGQLLVEVIHGGKSRSFVVDVQARA
jgi:hypothetical protein